MDWIWLIWWLIRQSILQMNLTGNPYLIPFDVNRGVLNSVSRFLLGVALFVTWKTLAKPIVFTILPPIYKAVGVYLPRRSYISTAHTQTSTRKIRSTSMSNDSNMGIGDINNFIKGVTDHNKKDEVGPETEIDYYEMLSYSQNQNSDTRQFKLHQNITVVCSNIVMM